MNKIVEFINFLELLKKDFGFTYIYDSLIDKYCSNDVNNGKFAYQITLNLDETVKKLYGKDNMFRMALLKNFDKWGNAEYEWFFNNEKSDYQMIYDKIYKIINKRCIL